jgi:hypothetical protein
MFIGQTESPKDNIRVQRCLGDVPDPLAVALFYRQRPYAHGNVKRLIFVNERSDHGGAILDFGQRLVLVDSCMRKGCEPEELLSNRDQELDEKEATEDQADP